MSECIDKKFRDMLSAYEIGMLCEQEEAEMEKHLLECEACMQEALGFAKTSLLLQKDSDIKKAINELVAEKKRQKIRSRRNVVKFGVVFAAVLIFLLIKPWDLRFEPTKEAMAFENILAVMYFDNLANPEDDTRLGEIICDLVITDMASSDYVHVMSSQRLYDILKLLGSEGKKKIDRNTATAIAQKGRARWMMTGSILQETPSIVLSTQIVDVSSGNVIGARRISGKSDEDVFEVVDKLTSEVRGLLSIPNEEIHKYDRAVADISTSSLEAYKYYIKGVNFMYRGLFVDARIELEKAQKLDSTFAMAFYMWSRCGLIENDNHRKAAIDAAMKYIDKTNDLQKRYIRARHAEIYEDYETAIKIYKEIINIYPDEKFAYYFLGSGYHETGGYQESIDMLLKAVEIDPMFKRAYFRLYSRYRLVDQQDRAKWALDKYIELAPDDPGPHYTRGNQFLNQGRFDDALVSYQSALDIAPDYIGAIIHIGNIYHFKREFTRADSVYSILLSHRKAETRAHARARLTQTPRAQGRFKTTLKMIEQAIADDEKDIGMSIALGRKYMMAAGIYGYFLRQYDKAIEFAKKGLEIERQVARSYFANMSFGIVAVAYAMKDDFESADSIMNEIRAYYDESPNVEPGEEFLFYLALVEYEKGNYDSAIACLQPIVKGTSIFGAYHELGRAHYAAGNIDSAIINLERALNCYDRTRAESPEYTVLAEYDLALAYEAAGRMKLAIAQYKKFLQLWKNADPSLWMVQDARRRLKDIQDNL